MTASQALDAFLPGTLRDIILWRDSQEPVYALSAPRDEDRYYEQGWIEMARATVSTIQANATTNS